MKNTNDLYRQPGSVLADKRFNTCVQYANFISEFFQEHGITNWEIGEAKARFPIDEKFRDTSEDKINPDHYKVGGIETFNILRAKLSPTQLAGFCKGNVLKYITRADHKDKVDDLKKAKWYLDKLIEELDGKATR